MTFLHRTLLTTLLVLPLAAQDAPIQQAQLQQGPFIGHAERTSVRIWARTSAVGEYVLSAHPIDDDATPLTANAKAQLEHDLCVVFDLQGLTANQRYKYSIATKDGTNVCGGDGYEFRTAPEPTADCDVRIMFGSCCYEDEGTGDAWQRVQIEQPDTVVLLGDTPYIDNTRLRQQRRRYAAFAGFAPMAKLLRTTSWYGTWDDHDFGANDTDGNLEGKENARRAFIEHRPNPSFGDGKNAGIYTSLRHGPVEVFVLDARWYASTAPSPANPAAPTLLGADQWAWLCAGLKTSTAPVKVLLTGMVWNDAVRPNKTDHWGAYAEERDALFAFLGRERISGVVLVGGDIHRSRILRHPTDESVGYPLLEFISSPLHDRIIASANQPHPGLIADFGTPQTWLELRIDPCAPALVTASLRSASAEQLFEIALSAQQLSPGKADGQER